MFFSEYNGAMHVTAIEDDDTNVVIPDLHQDMVVTSVCSFESSNIESITIGNNIIELVDGMFCECKLLRKVIIPEGIEEIPEDCFYGCSRLSMVKVPRSVKRIGKNAFYKCSSLRSIDLSGVRVVEFGAFSKSGLESVELPKVKVLEGNVFRDCEDLQKAVIGGSIDSIHTMTFSDCTELEEVVLPDSVKRLAMKAFEGCSSLKEINEPKSLVSVAASSFAECSGLAGNSITKERYPESTTVKDDRRAATRELKLNFGGGN